MTDIATKQLIAALAEGFEGPASARSYYLDADAGLIGTLAKLTPEEASRAWGGNSVAAHAHHILFGLEAFAAFIEGDRTQRDWSQSWRVNEVDEEAWQKLRADLDAGYARLRTAMEANAAKSEAQMGGSVGAVAHVAYHVGAIRQKLAARAAQ
ncbi:MAG TPA: DinB family protein [Thermoanaerobaculia bacterium]|nr:DinB family protein [Thermoanaerobaculia bacterium]